MSVELPVFPPGRRHSAGLVLVFGTTLAALLTAAPLVGKHGLGAQSPGDTLTLSLAEVQRLAALQNPVLVAVQQEAAIARGARRQAGLLRSNPEFALQSTGYSGGRTGSPLELTLLQEVEWAGQRGLRRDAGDHGVARAAGMVLDAGRLTLADASAGFYRAIAAQGRLRVARDALQLTGQLLAAVRTQVREGEISTLEANLAEIEFGRSRGRALAAERAAVSAALQLKLITGLSADTPLRLVDDTLIPGVLSPTLSEDSLVRTALARRPDLAATTAAVREAEALRRLARREALPNLRLGAVAERGSGGGGLRIGPAIGLSLPLFNRNQGVVDQRAALTEQARLERLATEMRIRTDVADAMRAYRIATEETGVFAVSVLQPARENSQLLETAFRAGKLALPTLLLLRNQLLDAELGYWDAWLAQHEAFIRLAAATGALSLPTADPSDRNLP
ncbi:MAG: TolC family protein [Gemmatimonadales bacterium]|nr:TolC family protein [Gemmatimonadales bacterium]